MLSQFPPLGANTAGHYGAYRSAEYTISALSGAFSVERAGSRQGALGNFFCFHLMEMGILPKPKEHIFFSRSSDFFIKIHISLMAGWLAHLIV